MVRICDFGPGHPLFNPLLVTCCLHKAATFFFKVQQLKQELLWILRVSDRPLGEDLFRGFLYGIQWWVLGVVRSCRGNKVKQDSYIVQLILVYAFLMSMVSDCICSHNSL